MNGLTPRQLAILTAIEEAIARDGYAPSMAEIARCVGLVSTSSVAHQLRNLERLGYLTRGPVGSSRTIALSHAVAESDGP